MTAISEPDLAAELRDLTALPGPSGAEAPVAQWIAGRLDGLSVAPTTDALGNLLLGPARPRALVTAHMDQVGYMVSKVERDRVHCLSVGQPHTARAHRVPVQILGDDHPPLEGCFESFGDGYGTVRSGQLDRIRVGDRVLFADALALDQDGGVCGPALDNRIGCLVSLHAAHAIAGDQSNVAFAWTVREETEQAGVIRVARDMEPEVLIAVDITYSTASDEGVESVIATGSGPVITLLDGGMVAHKPLVRAFSSAANALGIQWQQEVVHGGVSEAGRVQSMLGIPALALLVPIENPHSPQEKGDLRDIASAVNLLRAGVQELGEAVSSTDQVTATLSGRSSLPSLVT